MKDGDSRKFSWCGDTCILLRSLIVSLSLFFFQVGWRGEQGSSDPAPIPRHAFTTVSDSQGEKWVCMCVCVLSHVRLFATPWTVARQAPLSMGFPRQDSWSGLLCPSPGGLPHPGSETGFLRSPALAFFTTVTPGKPRNVAYFHGKQNKQKPQVILIQTSRVCPHHLGGSLRCDCPTPPHSTSSHWKYEWPEGGMGVWAA